MDWGIGDLIGDVFGGVDDFFSGAGDWFGGGADATAGGYENFWSEAVPGGSDVAGGFYEGDFFGDNPGAGWEVPLSAGGIEPGYEAAGSGLLDSSGNPIYPPDVPGPPSMLSDLWSGAGNFLDGRFGSALLMGGLGVGGALLGANANRDAASTRANAALAGAGITAQANQAAREEFRAAANRGIGAINAGTADYAATVAPLLTPNPITLPAYRGLTTAQQIGLDDVRRNSAATLAASGLRGAGRAGVAATNDAERRYVASAMDRNDNTNLSARQDAQRRADASRTGLASVYANRGNSIANTEIGVGTQIGSNLTQTGQQQAAATISAAGAGADASVANAGIYGDALGAIGNIIASTAKDANRDKYGTNSRDV